jgi:antitoxin ParD1/3/4
MTINLSGRREELVRSLMISGKFASEEAVIDEALKLLHDREEGDRLDFLRREIALGIEQADRGELASFDPLATLARIRSRKQSGPGAD